MGTRMWVCPPVLGALPTELPRALGLGAGLEPATSRFSKAITGMTSTRALIHHLLPTRGLTRM